MRYIKITLLTVTLLVFGLPVLYISAFLYITIEANLYKAVVFELQPDPEGDRFLVMESMAGFGDLGWFIYRLSADGEITETMEEGRNRDGVLFWNYSEAGDQSTDPKLEIFDDRYLVFSRGGLYHSLYDLESQRILINEESPWNAFRDASYEAGTTHASHEEEEVATKRWKVKALHEPILQFLETSKAPD